jgi:hypothetical protein
VIDPTFDEISQLAQEGAGPDPDLPSYATPGSMLVEVAGEGEDREYEVLDWDENSGVFWINEGIGFGWWLEHYPEFPAPGLYLIENIRGEFIRGDGWHTDDSEDWEFDPPRAIGSALKEIARLRAENEALSRVHTADTIIARLRKVNAELQEALWLSNARLDAFGGTFNDDIIAHNRAILDRDLPTAADVRGILKTEATAAALLEGTPWKPDSTMPPGAALISSRGPSGP